MTSTRVTLVADELRGVHGGGLGTATSHLALALGRMGHRVQILYIGKPRHDGIDAGWTRLYENAGVSIQMLPRSHEAVEPPIFARMRDVELALRDEQPDVVISQDLAAPAYTALRMRQLGLGFEKTLFVVFCHGTRRWITDVARKVRVLPGALAVTVLERASIELADSVVSPSSYMVDWMRREGWQLPENTLVIPYLTRSGATGQPPPTEAGGHGPSRVGRIAFFGRLEERKGLRPFTAALNALAPSLLEGIELEFLGMPTARWSPEHVLGLLSKSTIQALARVSFETKLEQQEALTRLSRQGTLAMIMSLEDNSPNTVYECLERGIPFIASCRGGTGELIATEDRDRVLCEPTAEGIATALTRVLRSPDVFPAPRAAFDDAAARERWAEVLAAAPHPLRRDPQQPAVDVIVVQRSPEPPTRCLSALAGQSYSNFGVIVVAACDAESAPGDVLAGKRPVTTVRCEGCSTESARRSGLAFGNAPWVVFLDEEDEPEQELLQTLVRAQEASRADVISCAIEVETAGRRTEHFFLGDPGGLGTLFNGYGTVALLRRSLLSEDSALWEASDPDWPLLARLSVAGARIVSIPIPLLNRTGRPGTLERSSGDALLVLEHVERALPHSLRSLARLAAGLASDAAPISHERHRRSVVKQARDVLHDADPAEFARRTLVRVTHLRS